MNQMFVKKMTKTIMKNIVLVDYPMDQCDVANEELFPIINKIRKVVKIFRTSPTKNDDILQKHVTNKFGSTLSLILDSKTRWNSLLAMLNRFFKLKSAVRKSLIDLNADINFSENELKLVNEMISALEPIKLAVESLGLSDFTLLSANVTFKFMLDELSKQNTALSRELQRELITRIEERRTIYSDVLQFLQNPLEYETIKDSSNYGLFNKLKK